MKKEKVLLDYSMHEITRNELLFNMIYMEIRNHYFITSHVITYIIEISELFKGCMFMGIKFASLEDLEWINHQYKNVGFVPSDLKKDKVAIITYNGEYAGLGRLVYIDQNTIEMGGIYILPKYRGYKLVGDLVSFLVQEAKQSDASHVYCIPFEELADFYKKYGYKEVNLDQETVHPTIMTKYRWCLQEYEKNVLLFTL